MHQTEDCTTSTRNHTKKPLEINSSGFSYTASGYHSFDAVEIFLYRACLEMSQYRKRLSLFRLYGWMNELSMNYSSQYRKRLSFLRRWKNSAIHPYVKESQYRRRLSFLRPPKRVITEVVIKQSQYRKRLSFLRLNYS